MFDFSNTPVATSTTFITPGIYRFKVKDVKLGKSSGKGSEYLEVIFNQDELEFSEKFFLTAKALPRLQYLHAGWTGKPCAKTFKNVEEIEAYFKKLLVNPKAPAKAVLVGGQISKDVVYATLPYADFVLEGDDIKYGPFEEDSALYKNNVRHAKKSETEGTSNSILNESASSSPAETAAAEDDLPW